MPDPQRRSIRLHEYDYTQPGAYFVTIVTQDRAQILSTIIAGQVQLSPFGTIVEEELLRTHQIRPDVDIDAYVIMPNHIHILIIFTEAGVGAHSRAPQRSPNTLLHRPARSLGSVIAGIKSVTAMRGRILHQTVSGAHSCAPLQWQRNYYEHIIRSESDIGAIRAYIEANPVQWERDSENPDRKTGK